MRISKAQTRALAACARDTGVLLPEEVVEAARPKSSPLHSFFTWDNKKAAEERRRDQARELIQQFVKADIEHEEGEIIVNPTARVFIRDPLRAGNEAGYFSTEMMKKDAVRREAAMTVAIAELTRVLDAVESLARELNYLEEVKPVKRAVMRLKQRVAEAAA